MVGEEGAQSPGIPSLWWSREQAKLDMYSLKTQLVWPPVNHNHAVLYLHWKLDHSPTVHLRFIPIPARCGWNRSWTPLRRSWRCCGMMSHLRWGPGRSYLVWLLPPPHWALGLLLPWPWAAPCPPPLGGLLTLLSPSGWPCKHSSGSEGSGWTWVPSLRTNHEGHKGRIGRLV